MTSRTTLKALFLGFLIFLFDAALPGQASLLNLPFLCTVVLAMLYGVTGGLLGGIWSGVLVGVLSPEPLTKVVFFYAAFGYLVPLILGRKDREGISRQLWSALLTATLFTLSGAALFSPGRLSSLGSSALFPLLSHTAGIMILFYLIPKLTSGSEELARRIAT